MSTKKIETLLQKLQTRTEESDLSWEKTTEDGQFQTVLGNYILRIWEVWESGPEPDYVLRITDDEGAVIETFSDIDLHKQNPEFLAFKTMGDIHRLARRSAMGADKALDTIIKELDDIPLF